MTDLVFFYGTLMSGFRQRSRKELDRQLRPAGYGWIPATLFDLGIYPAAVPADDARVWGEVHQMLDSAAVLQEIDEIEGFSADEPDTSLYHRVVAPLTFEDGRVVPVWVYFYNAPLGRAERIESGDYLQHLRIK